MERDIYVASRPGLRRDKLTGASAAQLSELQTDHQTMAGDRGRVKCD